MSSTGSVSTWLIDAIASGYAVAPSARSASRLTSASGDFSCATT